MPTIRCPRPLALLVLQLALAGAAAAQTPVPSSPFDSDLSKRAKVIGVMVTVGHQAQVVTLGGLVNVSRVDRLVSRDDTLLADRVYAKAKAELEIEQRWQVRRVEIGAAEARALANQLWSRQEDRFGRWPKDIKALVAGCQCDAVLLLTDGPSHNTMVEAGLTFGPSFVGKSGVFGGKEVARAHWRGGLLALLVDPATGDRIRTATAGDRPDYRDDVATYWPGADGAPNEAQWQGLADYLGGITPAYRKALAMVGLRPSCAHQYFVDTSATDAMRTGATLPPRVDPDPAKCAP